MTCDFFALATQGVQGLRPYQPGKPIEELERELGIAGITKLASNENPLGPSDASLKAVSACISELSRYPDGNGFVLKQALVNNLSVDLNQITLGNGSNDVLDLIARAFLSPGDEAIFSEFAFAVYPIATQSVGAVAVEVPAMNWGHDLSAMLDAVTSKTRVVFLANPNNPTGTWFSEQTLVRFMDQVSESVIVVLDEAYFEYVEEGAYTNGVALVTKYPNLIVTRTFSKAYGLAGLRVGYGISHQDIANLLNRVRQPFNVDLPALVAATAALSDTDYLKKGCKVNSDGIAQLYQGFESLQLEYIPSVGNFVCVDFKENAQPIYDELLRKGVIVRPVANYKMPTFLRVSVGLHRENEKFLIALRKVLKSRR